MFRPLFDGVLVAALLAGGQAGQAGRATDEAAVAATTARLKTIHKALTAYHREHAEWPGHLSDLVPEHLDRAALLDPADPETGDVGSAEAHKDPKFHVSYSYERCAKESNGLPDPLGRFPRSDLPGKSWGTWRHVNAHQEYYFGDQVPLVRCFLHRPPEDDRDSATDLVLNLTPAGRVYRSAFRWQAHPDSAAFMLRTLRRDLTQGPGHVDRRWQLYRVYGHLMDADLSGHTDAARDTAAALFAVRDALPDQRRDACKVAADLFHKGGQFREALAALDACATYPGAEWDPIVEGQMRAAALHGLEQWDKEIAVLEDLHRRRPAVGSYMRRLAAAHALAGRPARAAEWAKKADPGERLVGGPAPEFRLPLLDGRTVTLAEARAGKKAVLLNFWFCGCDPCRREFPHLQKVYESAGRRGLEVVAVNRGDAKDAVGRFVKDKYTFPVALGRGADGRDAPLFAAYHVSFFPTSYLIDGAGKVVWRHEGYGPDLKKGLAEALAALDIR